MTSRHLEAALVLLMFIQTAAISGVVAWMTTRFSVSPADVLNRINQVEIKLIELHNQDAEEMFLRDMHRKESKLVP